MVWILLLALLSQAVSALVKWRVVASAVLLGLFLFRQCLANLSTSYSKLVWHLMSLGALMTNVNSGLFRTFDSTGAKCSERDIDDNVSARLCWLNRRSGPRGRCLLCALCLCACCVGR